MYRRSTHPYSLRISLLRRKFLSDSFFHRIITLWNRPPRGWLLSHYDLKFCKSRVNHPTYPHILLPLFTPLQQQPPIQQSSIYRILLERFIGFKEHTLPAINSLKQGFTASLLQLYRKLRWVGGFYDLSILDVLFESLRKHCSLYLSL